MSSNQACSLSKRSASTSRPAPFGLQTAKYVSGKHISLFQKKRQVLLPLVLLRNPLLDDPRKAPVNLCLRIAAACGVFPQSSQHADNPAAFFALPTGKHPVPLNVGGMAGDLRSLRFRIPLHQDLFHQQFR